MTSQHQPSATFAPNQRFIALRQRLQWTCRGIAIGAVLVAIWMIASQAWPWRDPGRFIGQIAALYRLNPAAVTPDGYWIAFAVHIAATATVILPVASIIQLVRGFLAGHFFEPTTASRIRRFGKAVMVMAIADVIKRPVIFVIAWPDLIGRAPIFEIGDLLLFAFAFFMIGLAAVFREASVVADEHRAFV